MALIDKLTAIADAIRGKTSGTDLLTLDEMAAAIAAISGGGNSLPEPKLLCTLAAEMNKTEWLTANPIPLRYKHSILFIKYTGDNIATTGEYTERWLIHFIGQVTDSENDGEIRSQVNGLVAPDSLTFWHTIYGANGSYAKCIDNQLTAGNLTNTARYIAAGNSIYYLEIPFNFRTMTFDFEEREAAE